MKSGTSEFGMANPHKKTVITVLSTLVVAFALAVLGALAVDYSGVVDVAATNRASGVLGWFLESTRDHSIEARASHIRVPELGGAHVLEVGADHYHQMCVGCHGAPGVEVSDASRGMEPRPPDLDEGPEMSREEAAETFWIVKNGIQMTGMPAFGETHDDDELWAIVAFVAKLREMSPDDYDAATTSEGEEDETHHASLLPSEASAAPAVDVNAHGE